MASMGVFTKTLGCLLALSSYCSAADNSSIQHDEEHYTLYSQHQQAWAADDKLVDKQLAEIRRKHRGKRPNIIYILLDDIGYGEMGSPQLNYYNGYKTPNINAFAAEGVSFARMYSESVCTPTRVAFSTGRYPVRAGVNETKITIAGEGLPAEEVTIAEVLSKSGYRTVHIGKWHLGDIEQSLPHNQGFDYAEFPMHQQGQLSIMHKDAENAGVVTGLSDASHSSQFVMDKTFRLKAGDLLTALVAEKGGKATEVNMKAGEEWSEAKYRQMNLNYQQSMLDQLDKLGGQDQPFFLEYWPLYPLTFSRVGIEQFESRNGGTMAESMQEVDAWVGDIMKKINDLGIADNTLVVLMGDNGPFKQYQHITGQAQRLYRGGKGDHLEGGIRVDAFARWPGVIEAGSLVGDMIYVGDLYTSFARLADATQYIPRDRIVDGVDQAPLMLLGENHGRRDYLFVYEGTALKSIIKEHYKMHLPPKGSSPLQARLFDLLRDPREEQGLDVADTFRRAVWAGNRMAEMAKGHMIAKQQFPDRAPTRAEPYTGITNLRPETIAVKNIFMRNQMRYRDYMKNAASPVTR